MKHIFGLKLRIVFYQIDWIYRWTKLYTLEQKILGTLLKVGEKVISEKEKKLAAKSPQTDRTEFEDEFSAHKSQSFIDQMFKSRDIFTSKQLNDEVHVMIVAVRTTFSNNQSILLSPSYFAIKIFLSLR
jgi:hypothetical protein